jgi:ferric-dicitrate binding protein FerR (iron transport regulator)
LNALLGKQENEELVKQWIDESFDKKLDHTMEAVTSHEILNTILLVKPERMPVANGSTVHRVHFLRTAWFRYAAAVVLVAGAALYFLLNTGKKEKQAVEIAQAEIQPARESAILTLANGETILLDTAANGNLTTQGGTQVVKLANGEILYTGGASSDEVVWNTMSTAIGRQYQVSLPDGTRVWLNAASSITYPTAFKEAKRIVRVKGEVYFEVAKDQNRPFHVEVYGGSEVQVLGTSFNINSYDNEPGSKTTLLEGSVKVVSSGEGIMLKPGQQAAIAYTGQNIAGSNKIIVASAVDTEHALAWKNGLFNFEGLDIKAAMRQLERWYNIKVEYAPGAKIDNDAFGGKMYRNSSLSDVLAILQKLAGVKFRMEGNKVTVI